MYFCWGKQENIYWHEVEGFKANKHGVQILLLDP